MLNKIQNRIDNCVTSWKILLPANKITNKYCKTEDKTRNQQNFHNLHHLPIYDPMEWIFRGEVKLLNSETQVKIERSDAVARKKTTLPQNLSELRGTPKVSEENFPICQNLHVTREFLCAVFEYAF